jgi:nucleoside-diphosphate-sugar epimerase
MRFEMGKTQGQATRAADIYASESTWACFHVASPFPPAQPKDPDELIVPAREGTLRVLKAALDADVDRVVVTSLVAAVTGGTKPVSGPLTEQDWSDPDNLKMTPYARSKTTRTKPA